MASAKDCTRAELHCGNDHCGVRSNSYGGNIFFGYSRSEVISSNPAAPAGGSLQPAIRFANFNGWEVSLEGKFLPFLGIEVDVSERYASQSFTAVGMVLPGGGCPATQTVNARVLTGIAGS